MVNGLAKGKRTHGHKGRHDVYLDTTSRSMLRLDFNERPNVYFAGGSPKAHLNPVIAPSATWTPSVVSRSPNLFNRRACSTPSWGPAALGKTLGAKTWPVRPRTTRGYQQVNVLSLKHSSQVLIFETVLNASTPATGLLTAPTLKSSHRKCPRRCHTGTSEGKETYVHPTRRSAPPADVMASDDVYSNPKSMKPLTVRAPTGET